MNDLLPFNVQPVMPPLLALLASLLLVTLAAVAYRQPVRECALMAALLFTGRAAAVACLFLLLLNPVTRAAEDQPADRAPLWIMLDTSRSMHTQDVGSMRRIAAAVEALTEPETSTLIRRQFEVRWYATGSQLRPMTTGDIAAALDVARAGEASKLAGQLSEAVDALAAAGNRAGQPGVMLVVSDGRDTTGGDLGEVGRIARSQGITVHAVTTGRQRLLRDIAVSAFPLQPHVFTGETATIAATVQQVGFDGRSLSLRLVDRASGTPVVLDEHDVHLTRASHDVTLSFTPQRAGEHVLTVEATAFSDESVDENNRQPVVIDVRSEPARVLLIAGEPHLDIRGLAQALRTDRRFNLTQIIRLSPLKMQVIEQAGQFEGSEALRRIPQTSAQFAAYDLVILGSHADRVLDARSAGELVEHVRSGGAVLLAQAANVATDRGAAATLAQLQPADVIDKKSRALAGASISATPAGHRHPALSALTSGVTSSAEADGEGLTHPDWPRVTRIAAVEPKGGAATLLQATTTTTTTTDNASRSAALPLLVTQPFGRGRIAAMYGSDWWRWRLRPPGEAQQRQWHDTLWQDMARWLISPDGFAPGQQLALTAAPHVAPAGQTIAIEATYRWAPGEQAPPVVVLTDEAGRTHDVDMQPIAGASAGYRGTFAPPQPGRYDLAARSPHAAKAQARTTLVAVADVTEQLHVSANRHGMRQMAELALGESLIVDDPDDARQIIDLLQPVSSNAAADVDRRVQPAGLQWWVMTLLLAWLCGEWIIRRRYGWA